MKQFLIAIDKVINTLVWANNEGFGKADETLSARAWRLQEKKNWKKFKYLVDLVFFWEKIDGVRSHCYLSFLAIKQRKNLPKEYSDQIK